MSEPVDAEGWRLNEPPSPAPWTQKGGLVISSEGHVVAVTESFTPMPDPNDWREDAPAWPEDGDVMAANGRLVAAAPDLLKAVRLLLQVRIENGGDPAADAEVRIAQAAIAKVEGRA